MHLVVDARLARSSGHRTYLTNLVPRIAARRPTWRITLLGDPALGAEAWTHGASIATAPFTTPVYGVREQLVLPRLASGADLLWVPHYNVPLVGGRPLAVTVHDLAHLRLRAYAASFTRRAYARTLFAAVRRRADRVIFVSEFSRREFSDLVGEPAGSSAVIHEGVDPIWFSAASDTSPERAPYFLFVGNLKPHKNLPRLVDAFASVADTTETTLVIVGRSEGFLTSEQRLSLDRLGARVKHVASCDDAALQRYVRHARALVFPSLYEGFGLPPLEAMAAGCPVIASRSASIPEVCGDAAMYFDALDTAALARALQDVDGDATRRRELAERGRVRAREFSWDRAADLTAVALESTLSR